MIQEIYDLLLTKNNLITIRIGRSNEKDSFLMSIMDENEALKIVGNIIKLVEDDNFIIMDHILIAIVIEIASDLRFKFKHKELSEKCNYLINYLNPFKTKDTRYLNELKREWRRGEIHDRRLPFLTRFKDDFDYFLEYSIDDFILIDTIKLLAEGKEVNLEQIKELSPSVNYLLVRYEMGFYDNDIRIGKILLKLCQEESFSLFWHKTKKDAVKGMKKVLMYE